MSARFHAGLAAALAATAAMAAVGAGIILMGGCAPTYMQSKGKKFEDLTLNNLIQWPEGQDYIEGIGNGRPPDGEKDVQKRRLASRGEAVLGAERQLIAQLERMVPRAQVRELLHKVEVRKVEYSYDDGCTVTLRIPKEFVEGKRPIE